MNICQALRTEPGAKFICNNFLNKINNVNFPLPRNLRKETQSININLTLLFMSLSLAKSKN